MVFYGSMNLKNLENSMLNYNQISNYINVFDDFWDLSDTEMMSNLVELPKEWSLYIINYKLNNISIDVTQDDLKGIITRFRGIFDDLGIDTEDRFKNMGTDMFYLSDVLFLEIAMNSMEIFNDMDDDYLCDMNPIIIGYIRIISTEEEKYEILHKLKKLELI